MKLHFAGSDNQKEYNDLLVECGITDRLESFFYLKNKLPSHDLFKNYLLDSGGFSARTSGKVIDVNKYAEYINLNDVKICFNLDTNDIDETQKNYEVLKKDTKAKILQVYHYSDFIKKRELLDYFLQTEDFISIGGMVGLKAGKENKKIFLNYVFSKTLDKIKVHGLGITSVDMIYDYPWYSVDSSSWLSFARYGTSLAIKDKRVQHYVNKTVHYIKKLEYDILRFKKIGEDATSLWKARGVQWVD